MLTLCSASRRLPDRWSADRRSCALPARSSTVPAAAGGRCWVWWVRPGSASRGSRPRSTAWPGGGASRSSPAPARPHGTTDAYLVWHADLARAVRGRPALPVAEQQARLAARIAERDGGSGQRAPLLGPVVNLTLPDSELTASLDPQTRAALLQTLLLDRSCATPRRRHHSCSCSRTATGWTRPRGSCSSSSPATSPRSGCSCLATSRPPEAGRPAFGSLTAARAFHRAAGARASRAGGRAPRRPADPLAGRRGRQPPATWSGRSRRWPAATPSTSRSWSSSCSRPTAAPLGHDALANLDLPATCGGW